MTQARLSKVYRVVVRLPLSHPLSLFLFENRVPWKFPEPKRRKNQEVLYVSIYTIKATSVAHVRAHGRRESGKSSGSLAQVSMTSER